MASYISARSQDFSLCYIYHIRPIAKYIKYIVNSSKVLLFCHKEETDFPRGIACSIAHLDLISSSSPRLSQSNNLVDYGRYHCMIGNA